MEQVLMYLLMGLWSKGVMRKMMKGVRMIHV